VVFVYEMARFQIAAQLEPTDNRCKGAQHEYDSLPNNPFLSRFYDKYVGAFHLENRRKSTSPFGGASKALRSQEQEQEQEKTFSSERKSCSDQGILATVASGNSQILSATRDGISSSDLESAIEDIFAYYLEETGRNPKTYSFTDLRKKKGIARLRQCLKKTGGNVPNAVALMKLAVDGLAASDWHMGRDPKTNGKPFYDWEKHVFKSYEQMEGWWNAVPTPVKVNGTNGHAFEVGA